MVYADEILKKKEPGNSSPIIQGTAAGAAVGLIGGILYAYFNKQNYLPSGLTGLLVGGICTRIFLIKI